MQDPSKSKQEFVHRPPGAQMSGEYPHEGYPYTLGGPGYMSVPVPTQPEMGTDDRPEDYIPDVVKQYLIYFRAMVAEKNVPVILELYENEFQRLSTRWFREYPWPEADKIADIVGNDEVFLHLYRELHYRHVYAMHKPTIMQRIESYYMYCTLFDFFLNREVPLDLELPNQWLWEIIDEFLYQYLQFVQFRSKLKSRTAEEIEHLKSQPRVWDVHSIMNILYSLVEKSNINRQLEVFQEGSDPATVAGEFGNRSLYKNLGYFSLIGLLRLHCQLGDYYLALEAVRNVQLSKKVLANTRVPASQISLHYHAGFCYLMARRYQDTIRVFSNIIGYIQRAKQHFPQDSYQLKQVMKQNDQMLSLLSIVLILFPQHVDETVNTQLKDKFAEKQAKLHKG
jgi:translation initiation factor 3 subunit L